MTKELEFAFDFASPNAYLVHKVLPALAARTGAQIRYTPCLLGGIFKAANNKAPMIQFADIPAKMAYEQLEMQRFIKRSDINLFQMNPHFPVNTLLIMRAAIVAQNEGIFDHYVDAVFSEMWEKGCNMADPEIVSKLLSHHGLDGDNLLAKTQDQTVKDLLIANTEKVVARGAFGIPTFFVGNEIFFGKERLNQVEAALNP